MTPVSIAGLSAPSEVAGDHRPLRVATNRLTNHPRCPRGAHWYLTRMVPEIADRLLPGEELHPMLSPTARCVHPGYGDAALDVYREVAERRRQRR
jgi:hypothetical protein